MAGCEMPSPSERVRASARRVMAQAELVRIVPAGIRRMADSLDPERLKEVYVWDREFHYEGSDERIVDYVFTLDALNFGSGFSPRWKRERPSSTYVTVAAALKRHADRGGTLDAETARLATSGWVAELLEVDPAFPLVGMFATALRELGEWVAGSYGTYSALLRSLPERGRAAALIEEMTSNLRCFDDRAAYRGSEVAFYKRAQILVNDLSLALRGAGLGNFDDLGSLTMFADNLVPHVLRIEGALEYSAELLDRIEAKEPFAPGSREEIEIRAAGVLGVEEIVRLRQDPSIFPAAVDVYLWNLGQDARFKCHPRHLCETFFY